jgi:hypothetical protein
MKVNKGATHPGAHGLRHLGLLLFVSFGFTVPATPKAAHLRMRSQLQGLTSAALIAATEPDTWIRLRAQSWMNEFSEDIQLRLSLWS